MFKYSLLISIILIITVCQVEGQKLIQTYSERNILDRTQFGHSMSSAGDVNGDGYEDMVIGSPGYYNEKGRSYIFLGGPLWDTIADVTMTGVAEYDFFGCSVSCAGDLNNDGFDDVIVGAFEYDEGRGVSYVYFGGVFMDNIPDLKLYGEESGDNYGYSVAGAGDLNGDGFDDLIIGAYEHGVRQGRGYIYYGGEFMDSIADLTLEGEVIYSFFGYSVSGAGDVNNDGFDDVLVGANRHDYYSGLSYLYYGGEEMDSIYDIVFVGETISSEFGSAVSSAGDINNDGFDDIVIGAYGFGNDRGRSYIYFGRVEMDSIADIVLEGESDNDLFGWSVSGGGDFNNDGFDDVLIGAYESGNMGKSYIYCGSSFIDSIPDVVIDGENLNYEYGRTVASIGDVNNDGYKDFAIAGKKMVTVNYGGLNIDSYPNSIMEGEGSQSSFGRNMSNVGDVNGDGFDDVLIADYLYYYATGRAYLYFGGLEIDNDADVVFTREYDGQGYSFGCSVSGGFDINGDGYDDFLIGEGTSSALTCCGSCFVYLGGDSIDEIADVEISINSSRFGKKVSMLGDVNGDGFDDFVVGQTESEEDFGYFYFYYGAEIIDSDPDLIIDGENIGGVIGHTISPAGDLNSDGFNDIVFYAYDPDTFRQNVYVYFGGNEINTTPDIIIPDNTNSYFFGSSVTGAGDINGDGYDDIILEEITYSSNSGKAHVYYGGLSMDSISDLTLSFGTVSHSLIVNSIGDINGDGYDDVIIGSNWLSDKYSLVYVFYGGENMDDIIDITFENDNSQGLTVAKMGDLNNDGYIELAISDNNLYCPGKVFLYSFDPKSFVQTIALTSIEKTSIVARGDLQNMGNSIVTMHGFCWAVEENPTILDSIIDLGQADSLGNFISEITNLSPYTTYYIRAFSVNDGGVSYGDEMEFTTLRDTQSIVFNPLESVTYGDSSFEVSAIATSGLPISFYSSNPEIATVSNNIVEITGGGRVLIAATQTGNNTYGPAIDAVQELIVDKAQLTVIADNKNKTEGQPNPQFTMTFEGFVNNDDENDIDFFPILYCNANEQSEPGEYTIYVTGGIDNSYSFNYINGVLFVNGVGISDDEHKDIILYPNPAHDYISIGFIDEYIGCSLVIFNSSGKIVYKKKEYLGNKIDISAFEEGVFLMKIENRNSQFVLRFIKE